MPSRRVLFIAALLVVLVPAVSFAKQKCAAAKIKAAVKKAQCKATLEANRAATDKPIDPEKLAKCESQFSEAFAKLEEKGDCRTTGDAAAIEVVVDTFVTALKGGLACPNGCLNGGTINSDCSCTCATGYESINGGCFRIIPDAGTNCGASCDEIAGTPDNPTDASQNILCAMLFPDRLNIPFCFDGTSECPPGSLCALADGECYFECTSP